AFMSEIENTSHQDLTEFVKIWLENETFDSASVLDRLKESKFMNAYFIVDSEGNKAKYEAYLNAEISDEAKIKLISENPTFIRKEDFNNKLKVRQAIAKSLSEIPSELKADYETLLNDASY